MKRFLGLSLTAFALTVCGCSEQFQQLGAGVLSGTGLVGQGEAESLFSAANKGVKSLQGLTEEQEYYLGRAVSATVLARYKPYRNAALTHYINDVALAVAAHSDRPETFGGYHVQVLDSNEINALSAPGGFIFITRGLLRQMPDEDALASVLAHEVGHIVLGHGVSAISKANMTQALLTVGKEAASHYGPSEVQALTSTFGDSVNDIVETLLTKGFSRRQEYAADEYAANLLHRTGYNSAALVAMLHSLERAPETSVGGWSSTHPKPADRIDEVESTVKKLGDGGAATESLRAQRFSKVIKSV